DSRAGIQINVPDQPETQNDQQGLEGVDEADLLAFFVGPAIVTDGDLVNPRFPLGQLYRDLRFDSEAVATQGNGLDQPNPKRLVAGFHVRQVQIGGDIAHS